MIFHRSVFILLLFSISSIQLSAQQPDFLDEDADYIWPTNASHYMSSTFGETRSRHFHSGIDIGTWGQEGHPVFAARDGKLHRAGVSARGYGNVVYLKHDDGSFTVYAHLKDFAPEIRAAVDSIRFEDYSFNFDAVLEDEDITFRQGEVIGLSGSTGVGPPHIHFEVRSPRNTPVNPLLTNIPVNDQVRQQFRELLIEPLSPTTFVEGKRELHERRPHFRDNHYDFGTIELTGPAGLAVNTFDRSDGSNNVHAVYELELLIDGEPYFHSRVDSFSFSQNRQMLIDRVYPVLRESRRGFQRLYQSPGNQLPLYETNEDFGIIDLDDGSYNAEIIARDYHGNSARAIANLEVNNANPDNHNPPQQKSAHPTVNIPLNGSADFKNWFWNNNWVAPKDTSKEIRMAKIGSYSNANILQNAGPEEIALSIAGKKSVEIFSEESAQRLHRIVPGTPEEIRTADQRVRANFAGGSVFDTLSVSITHGMEQGKPYVELIPENQPLAAPVQISLLLDENYREKDRLSFYSRNSDNFSRVSSVQSDHSIRASVNDFGRYYVVRDTIPPEISSPEIYQRSDGKWFASVTVNDELSGIDYASARFYIDDKRGIAEYNPDEKKLIYHHPDFNPSGQKHLEVVVPDHAGNVSQKSFETSP